MSDRFAANLAFYANTDQKWKFIFGDLRLAAKAELRDATHEFEIQPPLTEDVAIPEHGGFERIRNNYDPKTRLALNTEVETPQPTPGESP